MPAPDDPPAPKVRFANQLRGVAALCVVACHFVGYWDLRGRDVIAEATFSPPQTGAGLPSWAFLVVSRWFNSGHFGVALFFLISGFVIPFSLGRYSRKSFVVARILRIYPVYVAAVGLDLAILAASAAYWHQPMRIAVRTLLANALLVDNLAGIPSIDMVNWTLGIEMKFYLVVALFYGSIKAGRVSVLFLIAVVLAVLVAVVKIGGPIPILTPLSFDLLHVIFMMIGTLFKFHHDRALSTKQLVGGAAALLILSGGAMACWYGKAVLGVFPSYFYALGLFALLYGMRGEAKPSALLDRLADVSYPLYVIHALLGYVSLKFLLMGLGLTFFPALVLTVCWIGMVAWALHLSVEKASIAWGHRFRGSKA